MVYENFFEAVGNTPVIKSRTDFEMPFEVYIKLEGYNPTGSVKDRAALNIISDKIETGELTQGKTILDASSGSFACSIAYFGRILGFPVTVVTGSKMTKEKEDYVKYYGAKLIYHGNFTYEGNRYCLDLIKSDNAVEYCFLDQLHNWKNPEIHYKTTGPELLNQQEDIKAIAFSIGSGGTLYGVSKYVKENKPDVKIIAVVAASGTKIPGTGAFLDGDYKTPFIIDLFERSYIDHTEIVNIDEAVKSTKELRDQGFFVGLQTGAVYHGAVNAAKKMSITGKILVISGDSGWKNMGKLRQINQNQPV